MRKILEDVSTAMIFFKATKVDNRDKVDKWYYTEKSVELDSCIM